MVTTQIAKKRWLNSTVLGIGLASLFSDWSHEIATTAMPAFLATMGVAAAWLGVIEGVSDGLSSFAKMASGFYTDRLQRRKGIAVGGYLVTAIATASFALATNAWHVLAARGTAWLGRGVRTPVRKALLAASVSPDAYGRAFGLERTMDTLGAIIGPLSALILLQISAHNYRFLFLCTLLPGLLAAAVIAFFVREDKRAPVPHISFGERLRLLPSLYRRFLVAVGLFGSGDFSGHDNRGNALRLAQHFLRELFVHRGLAGGSDAEKPTPRPRLRVGRVDGNSHRFAATEHLDFSPRVWFWWDLCRHRRNGGGLALRRTCPKSSPRNGIWCIGYRKRHWRLPFEHRRRRVMVGLRHAGGLWL
jgi:MFS family permease